MTIVPEPYGTTPFPILSGTDTNVPPFHVLYNPSESISSNNNDDVDGGGSNVLITLQKPQTQQIAVYEATPNQESIHGASVLAVNQHFICYAVKNGLLRVLHRHSTLRTLLRSHSGQRVTDITFFQDGDVLATVGSYEEDNNTGTSNKKVTTTSSTTRSSRIVIWRIFDSSPELVAEKLLEIDTPTFTISRVVWHPFNPNQFWMIHTDRYNENVATLVETTRIATHQHPIEQHAVCTFYNDYCIMKDAIQLKPPMRSSSSSSSSGPINLTDVCWNARNVRYVLAVYDSGSIILWDVQGNNNTTTTSSTSEDGTIIPSIVGQVFDDLDSDLSRCLFLPHEDSVVASTSSSSKKALTTCFVTASQRNASFTLWSGWSTDGTKFLPTKIQKITTVGLGSIPKGLSLSSSSSLFSNSSYVLEVCFGPAPEHASPPSCFIVTADREAGRIFAYHCKATWCNPTSDTRRVLLAGCDYVVPFETKYPVYSWSVVCAPTQDISEEELSEQGGLIFDMKLFSYQSSVVQCLTLTSYMCLPPESSWTDSTPGVIVKPLPTTTTTTTTTANGLPTNTVITESVADSVDEEIYDEEYEIDADDEDDGDDDEDDLEDFETTAPPEASALPPPAIMSIRSNNIEANGPFIAPTTSSTATTTQNPFANWLGSLAAKPIDAFPVAPPALINNNNNNKYHEEISVINPTEEPSIVKSSDQQVDYAESVSSSVPPVVEKLAALDLSRNATNIPVKDKDREITNPLLSDMGPLQPYYELTRETQPQPLISSLDNNELLRHIIRDELTQTVVPTLQEIITDAFKGGVVPSKNGDRTNELNNSRSPRSTTTESEKLLLDEDIMQAVIARAIKEPVRMAFTECIRNVLIPSLESMTNQVFATVSEHLESSAKTRQLEGSNTSKDLETMSRQLSTMTQLVARLTDEVQSLRKDVASMKTQQQQQQQPNQGMAGQIASATTQNRAPTPVDTLQARRNEILALLRERNYEQAFTKAISAGTGTGELIILCCRNTDPNEVLGGNSPVLSQTILLCLMQQLGAIVITAPNSNSLQLEMEWLQEIALTLNPSDVSIQRHVRSVVQQVVNNLNQKLKLIQGTDQIQLRRQLQRMLQLMRGIPIGSA